MYGNNYGGDNHGHGGSYNRRGRGGYYANKKRVRDDEYEESNSRRRSNQFGDYSSGRRDDRNRAPPPLSNHRFKELLYAVGDAETYDAARELQEQVETIDGQYRRDPKPVFDGFRALAAELPHKASHYAAVIAILSLTTKEKVQTLAERVKADAAKEQDEEMAEEKPAETYNVGKEVIQDLLKALQGFISEGKWRPVRYVLRLLSVVSNSIPHILPASSILGLLMPFKDALQNSSLGHSKKDTLSRILIETCLVLESEGEEDIKDIKTAITDYSESRSLELGAFGKEVQEHEDRFVSLISSFTLEHLARPGQSLQFFVNPFTLLKRPETEDAPIIEMPELSLSLEPETEPTLPSVSITAGLRGDEGNGQDPVLFYHKLFDDETVPAPHDPAGTLLRSFIYDIIHNYEVNRKEGARILLDIPRWIRPGLLKIKQALKETEGRLEDEPEEVVASEWVLENLVVEAVLAHHFALPGPPFPIIYYASLLTELCRLSPTTVAPSLGKCVRKLFASLGQSEGLEPENVRRFGKWWSVHLSNFGFAWAWADWAPEMEQEKNHPKRVFVENAIDLEVRLSYFDRVKNSIPEVLLSTGVMKDDAPGAEYAYENTEHRHYAAAASLAKLIRDKVSISEVQDELDSFKKSLISEDSLSEEEAAKTTQDMAVQTILTVGNRSFSHFLNVLERYLVLFRSMASTSTTRADLLKTVASYWRRHPQFHLITLDKVLQYQVVTPADVVNWLFEPFKGEMTETWSNIDRFEAVLLIVNLIFARTDNATKKLEAAKQVNDTGDLTEVDEEGRSRPVRSAEEQVAQAEAQLDAVAKDQKSVILLLIQRFASLVNSADGESDWEAWWAVGWFSEVCRKLAPHNVLNDPFVIEGVAKLGLPERSEVQKIMDSAKTWAESI